MSFNFIIYITSAQNVWNIFGKYTFLKLKSGRRVLYGANPRYQYGKYEDTLMKRLNYRQLITVLCITSMVSLTEMNRFQNYDFLFL